MHKDKLLAFSHRIPHNVPGTFYVTDACTNCGECYTKAPKVFHHDAATNKACVRHQPATAAEKGEAHRMMSRCPAHCIHDNGDRFEWPRDNPFAKKSA